MLSNCFKFVSTGLITLLILVILVIMTLVTMSKPNPDNPRGAAYVERLNKGLVDQDFRRK